MPKVNPVDFLDFLLKDLFKQIKGVDCEEKDLPYSKMVELLFKGVDLREKIISKALDDDNLPEINIVQGVDKDKV